MVVVPGNQNCTPAFYLVNPREKSSPEPSALAIRVIVQFAREDVSANDDQTCILHFGKIPVKVGNGRNRNLINHRCFFVFP